MQSGGLGEKTGKTHSSRRKKKFAKNFLRGGFSTRVDGRRILGNLPKGEEEDELASHKKSKLLGGRRVPHREKLARGGGGAGCWKDTEASKESGEGGGRLNQTGEKGNDLLSRGRPKEARRGGKDARRCSRTELSKSSMALTNSFCRHSRRQGKQTREAKAKKKPKVRAPFFSSGGSFLIGGKVCRSNKKKGKTPV